LKLWVCRGCPEAFADGTADLFIAADARDHAFSDPDKIIRAGFDGGADFVLQKPFKFAANGVAFRERRDVVEVAPGEGPERHAIPEFPAEFKGCRAEFFFDDRQDFSAHQRHDFLADDFGLVAVSQRRQIFATAFECSGEFAFNGGGEPCCAVLEEWFQTPCQFTAEFLPVTQENLCNLLAAVWRKQCFNDASERIIGGVIFDEKAVWAGGSSQIAVEPQHSTPCEHGVWSGSGAECGADAAHLYDATVGSLQEHRVVGGEEYQ